MTPKQALILEKIHNKILLELQSPVITRQDLEALRAYIRQGAETAFGSGSRESDRLDSALTPRVFVPGDDMANARLRRECVENAQQVVESIVEIHTDFNELDPEIFKGAERVNNAAGNKVFVVHGRETALREKAARFLEKAGLEPIILAEQPGKSQTLIEKLEEYGDVAFAVVLLTGDDIGGENAGELKPRARQNVVFELGYFVGLLTRKRVTALVDQRIEIFSDIDGVNYVPVDPADAWKNALARELQAAGFEIDLKALV